MLGSAAHPRLTPDSLDAQSGMRPALTDGAIGKRLIRRLSLGACNEPNIKTKNRIRHATSIHQPERRKLTKKVFFYHVWFGFQERKMVF